MYPSPRLWVGVFVANVVLVGMLSGCAGEQDLDEACAHGSAVRSTVGVEASSLVEAALAGATESPTQVESVQDALEAAQEEVSRPEVAAALEQITTDFSDVTTKAASLNRLNEQAVEADSDWGELASTVDAAGVSVELKYLAQQLDRSLAAFDDVCAAG